MGRILACLMAFILFLASIVVLISQMVGYPTELSATAKNASTKAIGEMIFSDYLFTFEVLSLVLLAAIIGAIFLVKRGIR